MTADQPHRDRIAHDLGSTLFVEAAAGTGKTAALVSRVVRLVATGAVEMRHVAAITFTEKAAAELRDRVRRGLTEAAESLPPDESARCRAGLTQLDEAAVTTLHSFARRILAEYPLEAGLPPRFEVLDDLEAEADFDIAYERLAGELFDEGDEAVRPALALGLRPRDLRGLARAFRQHWDRLIDHSFAAVPLPALDLETVAAPLAAAVGRLRECTAADDGMVRHLHSVAPFVDALREPNDDVGKLLTLRLGPTLSKRVGQAADWGGGDAIGEVRDVLRQAEEARTSMVQATCAALVARLAERVRLFTFAEADRRRREGRLEFHDLLVLARQLLREHEEVRTDLRQRWRRVLIDEFQDTDPLQIEIAVLLGTRARGVISDTWADVEVDEGYLFLVGDPKQSIYRFRRADIGLYQQVQERFVAGHVPLHANFRCAPPVVTWVNAVFEGLLGAGDPGRQPAYVGLEATRSVTGASVQGIGGPIEEPAGVVREREARDVAATVARVRDEGWTIHERDGVPRPASLRDVAILLPTRALLPELERALGEAGVPYRIESRSLLWATQEVRDLLAILRALDDPADEVALVAALRCPGFACRDDELFEWRRAGGPWNYLAPTPATVGPEHPVAEGMAALRALHDDLHWIPLHALVERVIRERRLVELQVGRVRPRDHWRRLRFVADQARAFHQSGGLTVRGFVDWAERQAEESAAVNESVVPEADDDAVSILTIHAAKGLEFPVVVLAGLGTYPPARRPPVVFRDGRALVALGTKAMGFCADGYDDARREEEQAETAEGVRLLYVAATRARDHFVVSLHHKASERRCHAHRLAHGPADLDSLWVAPNALGPAPSVPISSPSVPDRGAWMAARDGLAASGRAPVVAATAVGGQLVSDDEPPDAPPWKRGRAGTAVGRAVHAVLQSVDLATGEGLDALAAAQAGAEGVPERKNDIARAARAALGSTAVKAAVEGRRFWREVYVAAAIDGVVLEGFVDLLAERPDGLVVIDYKTDRVTGDPAELVDRYRLQGAAYATALEATLGRPVVACTFVFVGDGRPIQVDVADLRAAMGDVRTALSAR